LNYYKKKQDSKEKVVVVWINDHDLLEYEKKVEYMRYFDGELECLVKNIAEKGNLNGQDEKGYRNQKQ